MVTLKELNETIRTGRDNIDAAGSSDEFKEALKAFFKSIRKYNIDLINAGRPEPGKEFFSYYEKGYQSVIKIYINYNSNKASIEFIHY